jgi:hypothetical protein
LSCFPPSRSLLRTRPKRRKSWTSSRRFCNRCCNRPGPGKSRGHHGPGCGARGRGSWQIEVVSLPRLTGPPAAAVPLITSKRIAFAHPAGSGSWSIGRLSPLSATCDALAGWDRAGANKDSRTTGGSARLKIATLGPGSPSQRNRKLHRHVPSSPFAHFNRRGAIFLAKASIPKTKMNCP